MKKLIWGMTALIVALAITIVVVLVNQNDDKVPAQLSNKDKYLEITGRFNIPTETAQSLAAFDCASLTTDLFSLDYVMEKNQEALGSEFLAGMVLKTSSLAFCPDQGYKIEEYFNGN